jgi:hypothetical protein
LALRGLLAGVLTRGAVGKEDVADVEADDLGEPQARAEGEGDEDCLPEAFGYGFEQRLLVMASQG